MTSDKKKLINECEGILKIIDSFFKKHKLNPSSILKFLFFFCNILGSVIFLFCVYSLFYFREPNYLLATICAALSGIFFTNAYNLKNRILEKSKFYLNYVIDGIKESYSMVDENKKSNI